MDKKIRIEKKDDISFVLTITFVQNREGESIHVNADTHGDLNMSRWTCIAGALTELIHQINSQKKEVRDLADVKKENYYG